MAHDTAFDRHPVLTLSAVCVFLLVFTGLLAEIVLRFTLPYDIGYYQAVTKPGRYEYPFGAITLNKDRYPDEEFDLDSPKKRIGYFGDSVTYGTGAGSGYRFSDILQEKFPDKEHWTFAMISNGIQDMRLLETAQKYDLDMVIYALNLNDILPVMSTGSGNMEVTPLVAHIRNWVFRHFDFLRGRSYLYTWVRTAVKDALTRMGYGHMGYKAAELFPKKNDALLQDVASRINAIGEDLKKRKIGFCILILPYEMQISRDAAKTYAGLGIAWEDGFLDGSTQNALKKYLKGMPVYDGRDAFRGHEAPAGTYFVYNKGDKIDFNHPTREGHALLAQGFSYSRACF